MAPETSTSKGCLSGSCPREIVLAIEDNRSNKLWFAFHGDSFCSRAESELEQNENRVVKQEKSR